MINVVILMGKVKRIETKTTQYGNEMTTIYMVTEKQYTDSRGNHQEKSTSHQVNCYDKISRIVREHIHVGDLIYVQGEIQCTKTENGNLLDHYVYSINAQQVKFIPTGNKRQSF